MLDELGDARRPLVGAGFRCPASWMCRRTPVSAICGSARKDVPIASMLGNALSIAVAIEDDTLAFGLAHHLFGLGRHHQNFLVLAAGRGIGCAAIMDNQVRRGALGNAGKMGHMLCEDPETATGPVCECGRQGWTPARRPRCRIPSKIRHSCARSDGSASASVMSPGVAAAGADAS
ncbi:MAG: ROK family protein, partial [Paracoccus sp. (in: a-proteobacteria)]